MGPWSPPDCRRAKTCFIRASNFSCEICSDILSNLRVIILAHATLFLTALQRAVSRLLMFQLALCLLELPAQVLLALQRSVELPLLETKLLLQRIDLVGYVGILADRIKHWRGGGAARVGASGFGRGPIRGRSRARRSALRVRLHWPDLAFIGSIHRFHQLVVPGGCFVRLQLGA